MSSASDPASEPHGPADSSGSSLFGAHGAGNGNGGELQQRLAEAHRRHFRRNLRLTLVLLVFWAIAGLGCGVLFADTLNQFRFLGFPLGFWFAQQGAIVVFVVLILVYALGMGRLDRALAKEVQAIQAEEEHS